MRREIVVLQDSSSSVELCSPLADRGWRAQRVFSPEQLHEDDPTQRVDVGIVVFDPPGAFETATVAQLLTGATQWVAIVDRMVAPPPDLARLLAEGFVDFHTMPVDIDRLAIILGHLAGKADLRRSLQTEEGGTRGQYGMIGTSAPMREVYRAIAKVVRAEAPVLVTGESGTGKELVARAVHQHSVRKHRPFIAVNCGALPLTLIASELFGHEKGAFTGAHQRKIGSIEAAAGGTIFLDEVGDLPLEAQANLLRFLQERTVTRIGSTAPITVDARVIAATHVDLAAAVRTRRFREDLFYRLNVLPLHLPPLRERPGDIGLIADQVYTRFITQKAPQVQGFSVAARAAMEGHAWPGNVRELINRVQKAMIMCEGTMITAVDLGLAQTRRNEPRTSLVNARHATERDTVLAALDRNGRNMSAAARDLGISRVTLYRLLHRLEIARPATDLLGPPSRPPDDA